MMCFINIFCKMLDMWVGVGGGVGQYKLITLDHAGSSV